MDKLKTALLGLFGSGSAVGSVAVSETHIEYWLRIGVMVLGAISARVSIYWMNRLNKIKIMGANGVLCEACRSGHVPAHCPIPESERPLDCPLERKQ